MAGVLLNTRIPKELNDDIILFAKAAGYGNVQEFAREALREHLRQRRIEWGLQEAKRLYGSQKHKKIKELTREERDALVDEYFEKEEEQALLKLYGIAKHKKIKELTHKERNAIAKEYVKKVFVKK